MTDEGWIDASERKPSLSDYQNVRGGESTTDMVDVKFSDGTLGEGVWRDNYWRSSWMTRPLNDGGFLFNPAWSGINVTHWKPKQ